MPNAIKWQGAPVSRSNALSTELNALANNGRSNAGLVIDNSTSLDKFGWLELNVTFTTAPSADGYIAIYMVTAMDGTNFADGSASVNPGFDAWVCNLPVNAVTTAQNKQVGPILLPPAKFKLIAENKAGFALPATGTTIELFSNNDEIQ